MDSNPGSTSLQMTTLTTALRTHRITTQASGLTWRASLRSLPVSASPPDGVVAAVRTFYATYFLRREILRHVRSTLRPFYTSYVLCIVRSMRRAFYALRFYATSFLRHEILRYVISTS